MCSDTPGAKCRVVLCDDAADFVQLATLLLESEDLDVVGDAANGEEAVAMCRDLQPDVLLLDISMPVMDGLTALPHVREVSPGTNVIMLSGFGSTGMRGRAKELGAVDFIEKGVAPLALPAQVKQHCC